MSNPLNEPTQPVNEESKALRQQLENVKLGNLTRKHRKYQVWPLEKKIEVVSQYLVLGNMKLVSVSTNVDYALIRQWKLQPWWKDLENEIRATQNIAVDNKLSRIIERSMDATLDRLENGDIKVVNGKIFRQPVSMKDAAKVTTDFLGRQQVLRKEETETAQVSQISVTEQLKTLAMEFAKWQNKETAKTEAIDVESKEITDAISEEWEEGLQEGTPMGEDLEAESGEGSGGEECGPEGHGIESGGPQTS